MSEELYESREAIEVVLDECLKTLRENPLQTLKYGGFDGDSDRLLGLKPEKVYLSF